MYLKLLIINKFKFLFKLAITRYDISGNYIKPLGLGSFKWYIDIDCIVNKYSVRTVVIIVLSLCYKFINIFNIIKMIKIIYLFNVH